MPINDRTSRLRTVLFTAVLFVSYFIEYGVIKSFGVIIDDVVYQLDSNLSSVGLVFGAYHGISYFTAPFIAPTLKYLRLPWIALIGIVGSVGLSAASLATSIVQFAVCFVISGICYGYVTLVAVIQFNAYVPASQFAVAFGISGTGGAVGMIVLPVISEILKVTYGWRGCILILGGVLLHIPALLLLLAGEGGSLVEYVAMRAERQSYSGELTRDNINLNEENIMEDDEQEERPQSCQQESRSRHWYIEGCVLTPFLLLKKAMQFLWDFLNLSLLSRKPSMFTFYLFALTTSVASTAWIVFLIPHGEAKGFPLSLAVFLASFGGMGNIVGRIAQGPVVQKKFLSSVTLMMLFNVLNALVFLFDPLIRSFPVLGTAAFLGGLTVGARTALLAIALKELLKPEWFSTGYGLLCFFYSIGEPLGGLLSGWLSGRFGFGTAFPFLGILEILGTLFLLPSRYSIIGVQNAP